MLEAVVAPRACRAILKRRRPDVVFGGGGYVAGPMVLAARSMRIPAALSESDAHLGLANRLALPFAKTDLPRLPDPLQDRAQVSRHRPGDPGACTARAEGRGARAVRATRGPPRPARRRSPCGSPRAQRARARSLRGGRAGGSSHLGPARLRRSPASRGAPGLPVDSGDRPHRRRILRRRSRSRSLRELGVGDRRRRPTGCARAVSVRDRRSPGEERRAFRAGRRGDHDPRGRHRSVCPTWCARCSATRLVSSGWARRCCGRHGRMRQTRSRRS